MGRFHLIRRISACMLILAIVVHMPAHAGDSIFVGANPPKSSVLQLPLFPAEERDIERLAEMLQTDMFYAVCLSGDTARVTREDRQPIELLATQLIASFPDPADPSNRDLWNSIKSRVEEAQRLGRAEEASRELANRILRAKLGYCLRGVLALDASDGFAEAIKQFRYARDITDIRLRELKIANFAKREFPIVSRDLRLTTIPYLFMHSRALDEKRRGLTDVILPNVSPTSRTGPWWKIEALCWLSRELNACCAVQSRMRQPGQVANPLMPTYYESSSNLIQYITAGHMYLDRTRAIVNQQSLSMAALSKAGFPTSVLDWDHNNVVDANEFELYCKRFEKAFPRSAPDVIRTMAHDTATRTRAGTLQHAQVVRMACEEVPGLSGIYYDFEKWSVTSHEILRDESETERLINADFPQYNERP